jgi:hypothetical protein
LHFAWDVYGFLENRDFFNDPFAVEKNVNFGANGGPRARPRSAPEAPRRAPEAPTGPQKAWFSVRTTKVSANDGQISYRVEKTCKKERAETMLKKRPKNLAQKPLLKAVKRLNFITFLLVFDDFRKNELILIFRDDFFFGGGPGHDFGAT